MSVHVPQNDLTSRVRDRLKALMDEHHVSQNGLERATGYRQADISRFLRREMKHPDLAFLDDLFRVFQYTLADVLQAELPKPSLKAVELGVLTKLRTIKDEDRDAMVRVILGGQSAKRSGAAGRGRPTRRGKGGGGRGKTGKTETTP